MHISFDHVSYIYQPNSPFEHRALEDLTFSIESGSFVAVIGHTGSGKSTLIQHLNGLLQPTEGVIHIGDYTLKAGEKNKHLRELREKVGVVFQYPEHQLFEETVAKDIAFGPQNFGVDQKEIDRRINEAVKATKLPEALLDRSPFDLSGGQMRRVAISGVLAMEPKVLVLDEPTAGLDPSGQKQIMDMFYDLHKEKELTTVLVTHSMEDALSYADYILIMNHGKLYREGTPLELFQQEDVLEAVQLDVPEVIAFLTKAKKEYGINLEYKGQSLAELAKELAHQLRGGSDHE
ncbi:energy-coupling factor transport system ATP-binding protein [Halobacillus karajensis]|uniref:Energy-coupling factor transporter ATP-binding protein EcfA2 n=1 Tax=Halobacillus karajensis TaxID=195088 RepID=A0A024PAD0_9BACI|nr:energy-coupling factor ABC transporter ATP-binding protein [Halobacillus karajensis]CDQ21608.1 Energy-coupling factor transporter ATP-binding protein EcfA2 [Halobacillus karajensis]CDQ25686.1 Energy-coupling factor transporter ATP-binding protein EcfA2 [Halobacillus karajensis]CDQ29644.1 Energy-coupling factor transporter ATP-binding protein EcfA2 [Halobacillus karajensis]SEI11405.1 energy-coupling factor transport system ATP-binding protein [Halobacillus karajensis]